MALIHLIRHGETEYNQKGIVSGCIEVELTPKGHQQAQDLAETLKNKQVHYDKIICSPYIRARQTADYLKNLTAEKITYIENLHEINFGRYEGVSLDEVKKDVYNPPLTLHDIRIHNGEELRQYYDCLDPKYDDLAHPEGETKKQARERFLQAISQYLDSNPHINNLCVVAHGAVIRLSLAFIYQDFSIAKLPNSSVFEIKYSSQEGFLSNK